MLILASIGMGALCEALSHTIFGIDCMTVKSHHFTFQTNVDVENETFVRTV